MAAIIFDFDGTIADTFDDVVRLLHDLTGRQELLPPDEIERLRGMSLKHAAEDLHVAFWKMPFMLMRIRRRMAQKMPTIKVHQGIVEVIRKLHAEGHQLYIMSTNSERNIRPFLKRHKMDTEFVKIYGGVGLFGKAQALKKIIKRNNLDPNDSWYVGDQVLDIIGAQAAGLRVIAVVWGYNNAAILSEHKPTKLVQTPSEIISVIL